MPGVIDVTSFGGLTKQYQVQVDPYRMKGQGITLPHDHRGARRTPT